MNKIYQENIILASQSPRRKALLQQAGIKVEIRPANIDETLFDGSHPEILVQQLSRRKAEVISELYQNTWIIGADTMVVIDKIILGKPNSPEDAKRMLNLLSGRDHSVLTGFTVYRLDFGIQVTQFVETKVFFKVLSSEEIQWYTSTDEPYDKAGSYNIQGQAGFMIKSITGSYSNVVGLPICEVVEILKSLNVLKYY